jgi:hypothetical protein
MARTWGSLCGYRPVNVGSSPAPITVSYFFPKDRRMKPKDDILNDEAVGEEYEDDCDGMDGEE